MMQGTHGCEISEVDWSSAAGEVRELLREYQGALGVDLCFQDFEREVTELPGDYAQPRGTFLLAALRGETVGCAALRPLSDESCEMKRLYVRPAARGTGLGRALALRIVDEATRRGYRSIRLDTMPLMTNAIALYRALGFREIPAYRHNPVPGALYFELTLPA